jgi:hypothetical protein
MSSVISNVTPAPPPQELPHRNKDARGGCMATPPPPYVTAAPAPSPAPWRGSSFSSPLHYSGRSEPWRSATWPMINAAGWGAKSSPSGGAVVPVWGRACQGHPGSGGPPCSGVAKGAAPGSGVGGKGGGAGSRRGRCCHYAWRNTPASPPVGCRESRTRTYSNNAFLRMDKC